MAKQPIGAVRVELQNRIQIAAYRSFDGGMRHLFPIQSAWLQADNIQRNSERVGQRQKGRYGRTCSREAKYNAATALVFLNNERRGPWSQLNSTARCVTALAYCE